MCGQGRSPGPQHSQGPTRGRAAPLAALRQRGQRGSRHRPALPPPRAATAPRRRRAADDRTTAAGLAAAGRSLRGGTGPGAARGIPYSSPPPNSLPHPGRLPLRGAADAPLRDNDKNTPGAQDGAGGGGSGEPPRPTVTCQCSVRASARR